MTDKITAYWTDECPELSSMLWLPVEPVSTTEFDSWFSVQSSVSPDIGPVVNPQEYKPAGELTASRKVRIHPTANQRWMFRKWFGTARYVYNETVKMLNLPKEERPSNWMAAAKIVLDNLPEWANEIPYQIKKIAVQDAYNAWLNGVRKFKKTGSVFKLKFRSKKEPKQSCYIPAASVKPKSIYPRFAGRLHYSEPVPESPLDSRLVRENGRWFVSIPRKLPTYSTENQGRICAVDPGVRTFATVYSPFEVVKFGVGDFGRVMRLCAHLDVLNSKISKAKCKLKRRLKKAAERLRWKIKDLVGELHWKVGNYLVHNYDTILLPTFETQDMILRGARKINSDTARNMMTFSHYKFKLRLKYLASRFGKTVIDVNEAYTSKTASWTGEVKMKLGSAKFITSGGIKLDRDVNGARGILLRALVDSPSLRSNFALQNAVVNES